MPKSIRLVEVTAFLNGLLKNWQALILGGIVALGLTLWQWFGSPLSHMWYGVILLFTFFPAIYLTWRDEFRRANAVVGEVETLKETVRAAFGESRFATWCPLVALQSGDNGAEFRNELILKDTKNFELLSVELLSPDAVKLASIRTEPGQISAGFRVHIPHPDILKLWNRQYRKGLIRYAVRRGNDACTGTLPFVLEEEFIRNTLWIRLVG